MSSETRNQTHRVAVDIGGTFTDIATLAPDGTVATRKLLSTPTDYADAVLHGLLAHLKQRTLGPQDVDEVLHACTVATNTVLEAKGARTALITTRGFRDVLELRRTRIPRLYDLLYRLPEPLVPRRLRLEVRERMDAQGNVLTPLDAADVDRAVQVLREADVSAVAVCLLHSYANDAHERAIGRVLEAQLPGCFVSLSIDVLPQMLEYERTSTAVINAYIGPPVEHYLRSLVSRLREAKITGRLMIMQSNGGILDVSCVIRKPAAIVECGPAAGVIGAAVVGDMLGEPDIISFDMGGTTAKVSVIKDGQVGICTDHEVGSAESGSVATPLVGGGGHALKLPAVDIAEIGAGGGSIAHLDRAGLLKVGPQSAGAAPGPACYGAGGRAPTVTDANVVLGFLNPTSIAGGAVPIDLAAAERAVATLGASLGRDPLETARGIHEIANASMIRAIKAVTTHRGRDPRDFVLMAFGGSGGVHAVALARDLRIGRVMVPPVAGVFSALGLLLADSQVNISRAYLEAMDEIHDEDANEIYDDLEGQAAERIGGDRSTIRFERFVDMRYTGQAYELTIPLPAGPICKASCVKLSAAFEQAHERSYGHRFSGDYALEAVNLRVVATRPTPRPPRIRHVCESDAPRPGRRTTHFGARFGAVETPILDRRHLTVEPVPGPCIIEDVEGTIVVPPDCRVSVDPMSTVLVDLETDPS